MRKGEKGCGREAPSKFKSTRKAEICEEKRRAAILQKGREDSISEGRGKGDFGGPTVGKSDPVLEP